MDRKRIVLAVAAALLWTAAGVATASGGGFGEVISEDLLSHAVLFREVFRFTDTSQAGPEFALFGIADFDGDGFADLFSAYDARAVVLLGDGRGRFSPGPWSYFEPQPLKEGEKHPGRFMGGRWQEFPPQKIGRLEYFPQGEVFFPRGVVADFDGDGFPDLAATAFFLPGPKVKGEGKLYVFRNQQGESLVPSFKVALPLVASGVWASDLDGDGAVDLLLSRAEKKDEPLELYWCRGTGGFSFGEPVLSFRGEGELLHVGDMTGDGILDLLLGVEDGVLLVPGDGAGGFGEGELLSVEGRAFAATAGDLDGDGSPDLLLGDEKLVVALGQDDGFKIREGMPLGDRVWGLWPGDFDGDGNLDVLVELSGGYSDFLVVTGDGKGGFWGVTGDFVVPDAPYSHVGVSDLNGDGKPDLVFPSLSGFRVYLTGGGGGRSLHSCRGRPLALGDLNGDRFPDVVVGTVDGVGVFWNSGHGSVFRELVRGIPTPLAGAVVDGKVYLLSFTMLSRTETGTEIRAFSREGKPAGRWRIREPAIPVLAAGDFDGDGILDLSFPAKRRLYVLWGGKKLRGYAWEVGDLSLIGACDRDGDGVDELFAISTAEYADLVEVSLKGRKLKVSDPLLQLEALPLSLATGDLDGDGHGDVAVIAARLGVQGEEVVASGAVLGLSLSALGERVWEVPGFPEGEAPWAFSGLVMGDFTGDGIPDLSFSTAAGSGVYTMAGKGEGEFSEPVREDVPAGPLLAGDLDGNNQDELLAATVGIAPLLALIWNGGGR